MKRNAAVLIALCLLIIGCDPMNLGPDLSDATSTPAKPDKPAEPVKLDGTIIGTQYSVDYNNGDIQSTTVNTKNNVFDGNFDTLFASYERSRTC